MTIGSDSAKDEKELSSMNDTPQHFIKVNRRFVSLRVQRQVFEAIQGQRGILRGYSAHGPSSTIIHPSIYFLQDIYERHGIGQALKKFANDLAAFRACMFKPSTDMNPWFIERQFSKDCFQEPRDCRILVRDRAGIGKSTLVNRVFGVDVVSHIALEVEICAKTSTQTGRSDREHGKHNVEDGFELDTRPGLKIYDYVDTSLEIWRK